MGRLAAAAAVLVIAAPGLWLRLAGWIFYSASDPALRAIGTLNVAIWLGLGWVAFLVL